MNALQTLIRQRLDERGWSYGDVARRGGMPRSTVHHLATTATFTAMPQPATLERLARGLELPLQVVRSAAAEAAGLRLYDEDVRDPDTRTLIASVGELSPEDRRVVAALVESLLRRGR